MVPCSAKESDDIASNAELVVQAKEIAKKLLTN
jgi:hypothetical protein